ncbi:transposase [Schaalia turicensis]|uniref:transposase n=1 Tax=Schaalia turicensis TaxID=131111 RepID=UPI0034A42C21
MQAQTRKIVASSAVGSTKHADTRHYLHPTRHIQAQTRKALHQAQPGPGMIMHTDQGFQYQHHSWKALLANYNATQSMSRKGNCHDNAIAENFFAHLKAELFYQQAFTNTEDLANQIQDYIHWYNNQRIQQRLEGMTPNEYRNHALVA